MMLQIGLTGGIGSGKTTVAKIFEQAGYRVYYADTRAKALYVEDEALKAAIIELVGPEVYDENGQLDRQRFGQIIFNDKQILNAVNAIVHPAVARDFENWVNATPADYPHKFVLKEAAILFESGSHKQADGIICIYAPKTLRLQRVQTRDNVDRQAVVARMRNQWPDIEKVLASDFVIYNDGEHALIPQVLKAIDHFKADQA